MPACAGDARRHAPRIGRSFPIWQAGVDLDIQQGKPTGALAPWPVIGATCSGPVRQVPDPPVGSGGTPPTFASPRNRMGGRIRPPSVATGFLEGTSNPEPNTPTATRPTHRHPEARTSPGPPSCQCRGSITPAREAAESGRRYPPGVVASGLSLAGKIFGRPTNWEPLHPPISMFVSTPAFAVAQAFVARIGPLDQFVRCADRASPPPSR